MTEERVLDRLCAHHGIGARYHDIQGREHRVSDRTRRALLRAMGVPAGNEKTERHSLRAALEGDWQRILPPVQVLWEDAETLELPLTLPAELAGRTLRWVLREEQGAVTEGGLDLGGLADMEKRRVRGRTWTLKPITLPPPRQAGYHHLELYLDGPLPESLREPPPGLPDGPLASIRLILAPRACYQPEGVSGDRRAWGLTTTLQAVRSARDWGIGDFTDLTRLVELTAAAGGGAVALNPLHALFPRQPERRNPYEPSSRVFLNVLHLDVERIPELAACPELRAEIGSEDFQARLRAVRASTWIDFSVVARAKLGLLEGLYRHFRDHQLDPDGPGGQAFRAYCAQQGEPLRRFTLHEALAEHLSAGTGAPLALGDWPAPYRDPSSPEVAAFATAQADRLTFHAWLQWQAHRQLQAVGRRALELHLALGLCLDLAVGAAADGADAWADPEAFVTGATVGAPPDDFSPKGQNWGVLAWRPEALRERAYAPLIAALRANMRDAGALRIDHVMGLMRLFLIPAGASPKEGAYVHYPFAELLGVLTLESQRNRCLVIGEDLGTVPEEVRAALPPLGVLSFRLLYFEREAEGGFLPPARFESRAVVAAATHDLPTLTGFWRGLDLERRRALGLFARKRQYEDQLLGRNQDRARLLLALDHEGLLPEGTSRDPVALPALGPAHIQAIHAYLARTPAKLLLIQTDDLLGREEQVNLPGSGDAYPNWLQRQPLALEEWSEQPGIQALLAAVRRERGLAVGLPARSPPVGLGGNGGAGWSGDGAGSSAAPETGGIPARPDTRGAGDASDDQGAGGVAKAPGGLGAAAGQGTETGPRAWIPRATYRLQLQPGFGFAAAAELVPYLASLGISHCYCSPYFRARPGSTHGYDVVAHDQINPELGTAEDYARFCDALATHGMGQILDLVPNHVGILCRDNNWWLDVLENGPASPYAEYFDIDWEPLREELRGKVLVPVLGDHYGSVLDSRALHLVFADGAFRIEYYDHHFPLDPAEYPRILAPGLDRLRQRLGGERETLEAFESLVTAFGKLPGRGRGDAEGLAERRRDMRLHQRRLAELSAASADLDWYVHECLRDFNGAEDYPADVQRLHALLEAQAYRLAHWRVAADEINYRRFFDINSLAALRMENPATFDATHRLVLDLIAQGRVAGLRIDHPDGLYDPADYFRRLQAEAGARATAGHASGDRPQASAQRQLPLYVVVEKILVGDETLPPAWPVHGTTGYDFAALADALLVDPRGAVPLSDCYQAFTGAVKPLADEIHDAKRLVMRDLLSGELHVLASELSRIAELDPHTRDFTHHALRDALAEVVACFPVYRTYLTEAGAAPSDRAQVTKAVAEARRRSRTPDLTVFGFVQDVLLADIATGKPEDYRQRVLRLAMKFQQYTGPVTAKGVEDTAYYRYHRLVSLNEVGGDPDRFGVSPAAFHRANAHRSTERPHGLLAGSTHDSKRAEDVRARLQILSELPLAWRDRVMHWRKLSRPPWHAQENAPGDGTLPDANTEYLLYQSLLGAWPLEERPGDGLEAEALADFRTRLQGYMRKAVREAKVHTAWDNPDADYEAALEAFIDRLLDPDPANPFLADFLPFQRRIARLGLFNSLSQTLLRLTAPGVPDIYQGSELWNFSLVDPDNRRPVDFAHRQALLRQLNERITRGEGREELVAELLARPEDGRVKLYLIRQALALRRSNPGIFAAGDYCPLTVEGPHAERLCAFARRHGGHAVIVLAPRLLATLDHASRGQSGQHPLAPFADRGWATTFVEVPASSLWDVFAGRRRRASPAHPAGRAPGPNPDADPNGVPGTDSGVWTGWGDPTGAAGYRLCAVNVLRRFPVGLLLAENPHDG